MNVFYVVVGLFSILESVVLIALSALGLIALRLYSDKKVKRKEVKNKWKS